MTTLDDQKTAADRSTPPRIITGLCEVAAGHDALFCDAWGVIHNGREVMPGVPEALIRFKRDHGPVVVLTNAPRLSDVIPGQLDRLGLPREAYDAVVTSGDATRAEVERRAQTPFLRLGPAKDDGLFDAIEAAFVGEEEAGAILCTGLNDDVTETPEDYRDMLSRLAARGLPMVCANPDKVVRYGDRLMYCAGALADLYGELGGEVLMAGKPHAPIYRLAREAARAAGSACRAPLAIGDSVRTDIAGANNEGLPAIFVAGGVSLTEARGADGALDARAMHRMLIAGGARAPFAIEELCW